MGKITTAQMELALAEYFNIRQNLIVPNVSWGMVFHECDLLILSKSGYATEVEIKVSKADLIKDKKKRHSHNHTDIKYLYFAIPKSLLEYQDHVPERAGIITLEWKGVDIDCYRTEKKLFCEKIRRPKPYGNHQFTDHQRYQLARLGAIRIWGLKRKLLKGG